MKWLKYSLKRWWDLTVDELRDPVLCYYGIALAATHILSLAYLYWRDFNYIFEATYSICWPFFTSCYELRPWSKIFVNSFFIGYGAVALISAYFFFRRSIQWGWAFSVLALLMKFAITLQDYRMMGNYHYMPYIICVLYLFYPDKRQVIPRMIVGFYLGAGIIKFSFEWLSGASLLSLPPVTGWVLVVLCAYVVVLEMVISLGLLSSNRKIFIFSMVQVLIFHLASYQQVKFFYPGVMIALLMIFVLPSLLNKQLTLGLPAVSVRGAVPLVLFAAAQVFPYTLSKDPALTGQGRMFSLNMMDIHSQCSHSVIDRSGNLKQEVRWERRGGVRTQCDPIVLMSLAHQHCVKNKDRPGFKDLDLFLSGRRTTGEGRPILALRDFCTQEREYSIWKSNHFIIDQ